MCKMAEEVVNTEGQITGEFDEDAFYNYIDREYFLEGDNLRGLYDSVCTEFSKCSHKQDNSLYSSNGIEARVFSSFYGGYEEARVTIEYNDDPQGEFIITYFIPFIGERALSEGALDLLDCLEELAKKHNFELREAEN